MLQRYKKTLLIASAFALSACAALVPKEHLIPKQQLVDTMHKQFPLRWEKGLFSISLESPQLALNAAQNRLAMNAHFTAHVALVDIDGDFSSSSALRYDPKQRAVFLQGVSLDSLKLKRGNGFADVLRPEIGRMMNSYAASHPIYRFKPDELVVLGVKVDVGGISVVPEGLMLSLHPM